MYLSDFHGLYNGFAEGLVAASLCVALEKLLPLNPQPILEGNAPRMLE